VYLVTKNGKGKVGGPGAIKSFEDHLNASLERLRTSYVDCYYIHGVEGSELKLLKDPDVKAAFERLKKAGKLKYVGLSCHDAMLPEILETAAEVGWIDQAMIQYNFRKVDHDRLNRALDRAHKANIGLVAMKTQGGADAIIEAETNKQQSFAIDQNLRRFRDAGAKKEVAAIKAVWADDRMQVVVSEMTNFSDLRENVAASREPLTIKEASLLEEHRRATDHLYCHGCGHLCETAARGVPVSTVMRYLRYYASYGKRSEARALYQALPPSARALAEADLKAAETACPHGLPVVSLMNQAGRVLA
jgi:predicted aldo/keto reductase-like oxidoreductase